MMQLGQRFQVRIADIDILVFTEEKNAELATSPFYEPFLVSESDSFDVVIRVHLGIPRPYSKSKELFRATHGLDRGCGYASDSLWSIHRVDKKYMIMTSNLQLDQFPHIIAVFDSRCEAWDLYIPTNNKKPKPTSLDPFSPPMGPLIISNLVNRRVGVMLHACGVYHNDQGLTFCGRSGAGKSTIANLWLKKGATLISDDRLIMRKVHGRFYMYNTPRFGESHPRKAPVTNIYLLEHSSCNRTNKLQRSTAIARLMALCFQDYYSKKLLDCHLNFISELIQAVPIYELGFLPDDSVVDFISQGKFD